MKFGSQEVQDIIDIEMKKWDNNRLSKFDQIIIFLVLLGFKLIQDRIGYHLSVVRVLQATKLN